MEGYIVVAIILSVIAIIVSVFACTFVMSVLNEIKVLKAALTVVLESALEYMRAVQEDK